MKTSVPMLWFKASSVFLVAVTAVITILSFGIVYADAATIISIPPAPVVCGQPFQPPVVVDRVENLAGVKLVIKYDTSRLKYEAAEKGNAAASFMHVVNDKKPGELIIVMAGAKGISGKDIILITLRFTATAEAPNPAGSPVRIMEAELMNDQLTYIAVEIQETP